MKLSQADPGLPMRIGKRSLKFEHQVEDRRLIPGLGFAAPPPKSIQETEFQLFRAMSFLRKRAAA
jgi:hypothetical protein